DLSLPIDKYKALKMIDDKTSFYKIYEAHAHNYKDFFEFAEVFYNLELDKYISFIRTGEIKNKGWIRLGELLTGSKTVSVMDLEQGLNEQKQKRAYIGETLMKLGFIDEDTLRFSLKYQRWFSKTFEKAIF